MGLFDKKYCSICGEKIGLLGNRKLEDGNLCKECAARLSPWFSERRSSTVDQIKEQLEYRERNKEALTDFHPTRTLGENYKLILDENAKKFILTRSLKWQQENPDLIDFSMITGCETEVQESRTEKRRRLADGKEESYNPPRYSFSYDFYVRIFVNHPYFDEMKFQYNTSSIDDGDGLTMNAHMRHQNLYLTYEEKVEEFRETVCALMENTRAAEIEASRPRTQVTCPHCGAVTLPDANGCCEYCGLPVNK